MTELTKKIIKHIENNNNILLYQEELYDYYLNLKDEYSMVYISTPKKGKNAFELILKKLDKTISIKNKTISKLIEEIKENTKTNKLYILVDNFEQLSKRELLNYKELEQHKNINLIVNFVEDTEFIDENFLDKFVILNELEFKSNRSQSININYTILLLLSFLIFVLFLKLQFSNLRVIVSALWFTLLMYRSLYYISK